MAGRPPKTVNIYVAGVKQFFAEKGFEMLPEEWRRIGKRLMPKTSRVVTFDEKPTKTQLRSILNYMDVKGRSLFLFLASSGCRIGGGIAA